MIAVFYAPDTGAIQECTTGPAAWVEADGRPYVEVTEFRPNWDVTHRVEAGAVVPNT